MEEEGVWRDSETGEVLDISPMWTEGQPNGVRLQNCASIWEFDGGYDDGSCLGESQCSLCNFKFYPRTTLRGICQNQWTDVFYTVIVDDVTNMPYFRGNTGTIIQYDEDNQEWVMKIKDSENGVNGTAAASILPMGTGAQMWQINKDICNRNNLDPFNALMTVCTVFENISK